MQSRLHSMPRSPGPAFGLAGVPRVLLTSVLAGPAAGAWILAIGSHDGVWPNVLIGVAAAVAVAVLVLVVFVVLWHREGGRLRAQELDRWIHQARLPNEDLPSGTRERLAKRAEDLSRFWPNVVLAVIWSFYGVVQWMSHPTLDQAISSGGYVGLWLSFLAVSAYSRFHTLPIVNGLLTDLALRDLVS